MALQKYYFSNIDMGTNFETEKSMRIFIYPVDWWNIKSWMLAFDFNKSVEIIGMSNKNDKH